MKYFLKRGDEGLGVRDRLIAGSSAGVIAQTAIYPMEVCFNLYIVDLVSHDVHCLLILKVLSCDEVLCQCVCNCYIAKYIMFIQLFI